MTTSRTTQDRINTTADANGWTATQTMAGTVTTYRKGSRRVTVYTGVRGNVIECAWQTGSTGGRTLTATDTGKAERVLGLLAADRWTR